MKLFFSLVQAASFFLLVAYAYCKSPAYRPLRAEALTRRDRLALYLLFSAISIAGTYLGMPVHGAIANTRAMGPVLAGLLGGPVLGVAVGLTGGGHRFLLGGFTGLACGLSTVTEGAIGGLVHLWLLRRRGADAAFHPGVALATTAVAEATQMAIILLVARPFADALALVRVIALPMILANSAGAALFMSIIRDRRALADQMGAASTEAALRIAGRALGVLGKGFGREAAPELARIIHEESGVSAVAVTDAEKVLAFVGHGADHHLPGSPIASSWTKQAIAQNEVLFADGVQEPFRCPVAEGCPLRSVLVVPLQVDGEVVGTIKLYERAHKPFLRITRTLGEGLTALLAGQLLSARYQEQKRLAALAELKLARAQISPHFLFNSLATILAILRDDPARGRALVAHLSTFFRMNLKRAGEIATLEEELAHVGAYLEIEKARYEERLTVEVDVDPTLLQLKLPAFTLQPLLENAIKHGLSERVTPGTARIRAYRRDGAAVIDVEDDAGAFREGEGTADGLGLRIVDRRLRNLVGGSGLEITCVPRELTRVSLRLPLGEPRA
jgi:two-component system LytT family sensor kinase